MSELQKWITSISGAVVGQIAVLAFFYLLVVNTAAPSAARSNPPEQREVTVMLSQLLEQAKEEEPPLPEEPELEEEDPAAEDPVINERRFANTDSNTAQAEAPDRARFESDRNTIATTEFLPDETEPQIAGPTLRGEEKIKALSLADQEYFEGEILPDPTPPPAMNQAAAPPGEPTDSQELVEENTDTPPSESEEETEDPTAEELSEGEAEELKPGEADTPPDRPTDQLTQPETETLKEEAQLETSTNTFIDPSEASIMKIPTLKSEVDQEAFATQITEKFDEPSAPEEKKEIKAAPVIAGKSLDQIKQEIAAAAEAQIQKELDESMFNPAFLAHQRKNIQNGDITTIGEGSVAAESTEVGKYKKSVQQAIGQKWHQYRQDRGADVTWGHLRISFVVTPRGQVRNIEIRKKEVTELVTEFSLKAIVDADIPPMPRDVAAKLGPDGLEMHYNIVIY